MVDPLGCEKAHWRQVYDVHEENSGYDVTCVDTGSRTGHKKCGKQTGNMDIHYQPNFGDAAKNIGLLLPTESDVLCSLGRSPAVVEKRLKDA